MTELMKMLVNLLPLVLLVLLLVLGLGFWRAQRRRKATPQAPARSQNGLAHEGDMSAPGAQAEFLERSKLLIHGLVLDISKTLEQVLGHVDRHGSALDGHRHSLQKAATRVTLEEIEQALMREIETMQRTNEQYRQELSAANEKIHRQEQEMARLSLDVNQDFLTGIPNRRSLDHRLAEELGRTHRHGRPLSLLLLDIDHFKQVNDQYGHVAGDRLLRAVAALLDENRRTEDFLGRYGGEEFAVILPETELEQAMVVAEKLRRCIANAKLNYDGQVIRMTVTIGVAQAAPDGAGPAQLISRADKALYRGKEDGRNRVEQEG